MKYTTALPPFVPSAHFLHFDTLFIKADVNSVRIRYIIFFAEEWNDSLSDTAVRRPQKLSCPVTVLQSSMLIQVQFRKEGKVMLSLCYILRRLRPFLVRSVLRPGADACPERMELLCGQEVLTADRIYLGDARTSVFLQEIQIEPGSTILLSDGEDSLLPGFAPPDGSFSMFFCSLSKLYNIVAESVAQITAWRQEYQHLTDCGGGIHAIAARTAQLAGGAVLLLDQSGRVVVSAGMENSVYLAGQVVATGALPLHTAEHIFPQHSPDDFGSYSIPGMELTLYGRQMAHKGNPAGMLLVEKRDCQAEFDIDSLCACATECLNRRLLSFGTEQLGASTRLFQQCWEEIVSGRLTGTAEIRALLSNLPNPVEQFVQVAVVSFSDGGNSIPYNYVLARLREFFPQANMAVYHKDVVILLSYSERSLHTGLSCGTQLTALLARYNGFIAFSNGTRKLEALRSVFQLAKRTVLLARAIRTNPEERIFFHEDYSIYCVIDLCVQQYLNAPGNEDPFYLIHPAIVLLTRYDSAHNSNLRDVLYYYLLNDRNLVKTAAVTYMHRNTVINKINKITELLQVDLEDGKLCQRLIFSCQFIHYYERMMNREFRP